MRPRTLTAMLTSALLTLSAVPATADDLDPEPEHQATYTCVPDDPDPEYIAPHRFPDVSPGSTHSDAIVCIAARGITTGYEDGTFGAHRNTTRGQMAHFLNRVGRSTVVFDEDPDRFNHDFGDALTPPTQVFSDVPPLSLHGPAIHWIHSRGIANGVTATTFEPRADVTRAQMAAFLNRAHQDNFGEPIAAQVRTFPDVTPGSTHSADIGRLAATGITLGDRDGNFNPREPITRGQMASFITRYFELLDERGQLAQRFYDH